MSTPYIIERTENNVVAARGSTADDTSTSTETSGTATIATSISMEEWSSSTSPPLDTSCAPTSVDCRSSTRTSILITPSKRNSLSPPPISASSSSTTSSLISSSSLGHALANSGDNTTPGTESPALKSVESSKQDLTSESQSPTLQQLHGEEEEKEQKEHRLSVKFAPLPELAPRKRRGGPLGVAARSQLIRRSRALALEDGPQQYVVSTPMWTEQEVEQQRLRLAAAWERERERREYWSSADVNGVYGEEEADDPFAAFGRMMKDAGKHLWNKVANREGKGVAKLVNGEERKGKGKEKAEEGTDPEKKPIKVATSNPDGELMRSSLTLPGKKQESLLEEAEQGNGSDREKEKGGDDKAREVIEGQNESVLDVSDQGDTSTKTRKNPLWDRIRTESKPKSWPTTLTKSNSERISHSKASGRRSENKNREKDAETVEKKLDVDISASTGLRRSLSI
ncbi:hypothetical protein AX17_003923 [Amanita inopinata Kibby_2008]|nr:hypothetical protein AX17_003923 [Amanita inopinata Kibby_2008]